MSRSQGSAIPWEFPADQAALEERDYGEINTKAVWDESHHLISGSIITCTCAGCQKIRAYNESPAGRAEAARWKRESDEMAAEDAQEQKRRRAAAEANRRYRQSQLEQSA